VGGLTLVGGVLLQHLPYCTPRHPVRGRLRAPTPPILPYTVGSAKTEAADALLCSRMRCWQRCASGFYRRSSSPRSTTTPTIVTWSSTSAPGCGCASSTGPHCRSTRRLGASWVPAMLARSRCWSVSASRLPTTASGQCPDP
jgi:hypothetical protein